MSCAFSYAVFGLRKSKHRYHGSSLEQSEDEERDRRTQCIKYANETAQHTLAVFLQYYHLIPEGRALSARLEELHYTHLVISADKPGVYSRHAYKIYLQPPLESFYRLQGRLDTMYSNASLGLREGSIGGDSVTTSVIGRLKRSRRHLSRFSIFRTLKATDEGGSRR